MGTDDNVQLVYLILLGLFVGSYFFFDAGAKFGQNLKLAIVWFGIFGSVIVGYQMFQDAGVEQASVSDTSRVTSFVDREISLSRARDGHFYVTLEVNGAPVRFVVDTGASLVVLNERDARKIGLDPETLRFSSRARTANGEVRIAPVILDDIAIGGFSHSGVRAAVNGGQLDTSLLGMSYLRLFRIEIEDSRMKLTR